MTDQRYIQNGGDVPSDPELSRLYRQGAREEPPPHVDAAVLAAARRSAHGGPSPVDKPQRSARRWYVPLALAAVLVLSVSVAILSPEMDRLSQSDEGSPPEPATYEQRAPQEEQAKPQRPAAPAATATQSAPSARRSEKAAPPERPVSPPAIAQEAPAVQPEERLQRREDAAPSGAREAEQAASAKREVAPRVLSAPQAQSRAAGPSPLADSDPPERWGERIMALRVQGNAREADALLEEFKKRFPDYAIPEAWIR